MINYKTLMLKALHQGVLKHLLSDLKNSVKARHFFGRSEESKTSWSQYIRDVFFYFDKISAANRLVRQGRKRNVTNG